MIYDNPYCLQLSQWLVDRFYDDKDKLIKELSGELCRMHRMGLAFALDRINKTVKEVDKAKPR